VKKTTVLEQVKTPDGSTMALAEHDGNYIIRVDGRELMSTRHSFSEEELGRVACAPLSTKPKAKVLIGGLGLGFTLRAALKALGADAEVLVAELMPEVVAWNKNPAYPLAKDELADRRVRVQIADVYEVIRKSMGRFDAIMLDADNGTTAMMTEGNDRLYAKEGLVLVQAALRPGGRVVYWSAQAEPIFAKQMGKAGFKVEHLRVRAHESGGAQHTLLVGRF
jgi:spermidine synthase